MEVSAYCPCQKCCGWRRASSIPIFPGYYRKVFARGPDAGETYHGLTASGEKPVEFRSGLLAGENLIRPWIIVYRLILFWKIPGRDGTIAADTEYYPFGTRMFVSGYGWGKVRDRGRALKGPKKIDVFFSSHQEALDWGRQQIDVLVERNDGAG